MKKIVLLMAIIFIAGCQKALIDEPVQETMFNAAKISAEINVPGDYSTIQAAIDASDVPAGAVIKVANGNYAGAFVTKAVTIKGSGNTVINAGPLHSSGKVMGFRFLAGSKGSVISSLTFNVDFGIMNGAAINDVTVTQCVFNNSVQAVSNWCGSDWKITHNVISNLRCLNGGGIGIFIGDYKGGIVENNLVSHNEISGTLHVMAGENGGYSGAGIVLYADYRYKRDGALGIKNNSVLHNKVSLISDNPELVDVNALELTDTKDNPLLVPVLFDNKIGFNDFRGTVNQVAFSPENLVEVNIFSKNLGDNRGHGVHPSLFK